MDFDKPDIFGVKLENKDKKTFPRMTIFEKSKIIFKRVVQLEEGYTSTMHDYVIENNISSSFDIAILEFENNKLPEYKIKREFPDGSYELWSHSDFEFYPE